MEKNRMLIDATHPEETRVVAVRNGRVEDFDFESAARKLLRGNIYLAKVTRVEPSLQAAFVDYGGNRHGFLAFNEIHPDYYQIPVADREALKQEEAEAEAAEEAEVEARARARGPRRRRPGRGERPGLGRQPRAGGDEPAHTDSHPDDQPATGEVESGEAAPLAHDFSGADIRVGEPETSFPNVSGATAPSDDEAPQRILPPVPAKPRPVGSALATSSEEPDAHEADGYSDIAAIDPDRNDDDRDDDEGSGDGENGNGEDDQIEQVSSEEDALEELPERPRRRARQYKIQEVIKRRQIMLVQVVKEERGNKGAALTTYISLAGRYTVLMPNTGRGGGISRKITQPQDRKRLKAIAEELDVPEGMGLIIRTAGAARTKQEIRRDYEYLLRLWESVREVTLASTAPCLVYEEGNIIKRAIRDLYSKEFDQIVVAGTASHREAQDFMEMLMPGNGSHVAHYKDHEPLFARYGIERQLNALFSPYVTLRSGGYIVINQTEALVSVDVNSGKSTREFSIEETALNTNLEAAEEIARQLKLRDLAGLIVVDFIDMEEKRNNRAVERRLKDVLRHDRARIQVGRISHFGLLEMSRQRLRAGVLEGSTSQCPHCQGTGIIRSIESVALAVLRALEDHLIKQASSLVASTTAEVALYILNHKRAFIIEMERRYGVLVRVEASDRMHGANFAVERFATPVAQAKAATAAVSMEWGFDRDSDSEEIEDAPSRGAANDDDADVAEAAQSGDEERRGKRRRRRRGRRDRSEDGNDRQRADSQIGGSEGFAGQPDNDTGAIDAVETATEDDEETSAEAADEAVDQASADENERRRRGRRRGRRGGRTRRRDEPASAGEPRANLDDIDRNEWGIAEIARPGAEQPSGDAYSDASNSNHHRHGPAQHGSIVETVGGEEARGGEGHRRGRQRDGGFSAADEALRLARRLAGWETQRRPDERGQSRRRRPPEGEAQPELAAAPIEALVPAQPPVREATAAVAATPVAPPVPAPIRIRNPAPALSAQEAAPIIGGASGLDPSLAETATPPSEEAQAAGSNGHATMAPTEPDEARQPDAAATADPNRPQRRGWWQRRFGG